MREENEMISTVHVVDQIASMFLFANENRECVRDVKPGLVVQAFDAASSHDEREWAVNVLSRMVPAKTWNQVLAERPVAQAIMDKLESKSDLSDRLFNRWLTSVKASSPKLNKPQTKRHEYSQTVAAREYKTEELFAA